MLERLEICTCACERDIYTQIYMCTPVLWRNKVHHSQWWGDAFLVVLLHLLSPSSWELELSGGAGAGLHVRLIQALFLALQWRWPCWLDWFRLAANLLRSAGCRRKLLAVSPGNRHKTPSDYNITSFITEWKTQGMAATERLYERAGSSALWEQREGWGVAQASQCFP